jgi:hypothetical protein
VWDAINKAMQEFDAFLNKQYQARHHSTEELPVFNQLNFVRNIIDDLEHAFNLCLERRVKINESDRSFREFIFCIIFLLGNFKIQYGTTLLSLIVRYAQSVTLEARVMSAIYHNHFALLPIITLPNVWRSYFGNWAGDGVILKGYIARRLQEGHLAATPCSKDVGAQRHSVNEFQPRELWPFEAR